MSTPLLYQYTKFELPSLTDFKDIIGAKFKLTGHVTLTMSTRG